MKWLFKSVKLRSAKLIIMLVCILSSVFSLSFGANCPEGTSQQNCTCCGDSIGCATGPGKCATCSETCLICGACHKCTPEEFIIDNTSGPHYVEVPVSAGDPYYEYGGWDPSEGSPAVRTITIIQVVTVHWSNYTLQLGHLKCSGTPQNETIMHGSGSYIDFTETFTTETR